MTTYRTGNPIGSVDPRDLYDNAENTDVWTNSTAREYWDDRLGRNRKTIYGMEAEFNADQASRDNRFNTFIASSGYQFLGDYAAGIEITEYNQIIRDADGEFWRLSGEVELPYTTTGAGLPESDALTPLGDAVLRQQLSDPNQGAVLVSRAVLYANSISALESIPTGQLEEGKNASIYGCEFKWTSDKGWTPVRDVDIRAFGAVEDETETIDSSQAFKDAFAYAALHGVKVVGKGTYYLGSGDIELIAECDLSQTDLITNADYVGDVFCFVGGVVAKEFKFGEIRANKDYHLNVNGWPVQNSAIGHKAGSVTDKLIEFKSIRNYWAGIRIQPDSGNSGSQTFTYNTIRGLDVMDCKYNLMINPIGQGSWANQNLWDIRRIRNNSPSINGWGIYIVKDYVSEGVGPTGSPNENIFFNICLEGNGPNCIYSVNAYSAFLDCRFEARPSESIIFDSIINYSAFNRFVGGIGLTNITMKVVNGMPPYVVDGRGLSFVRRGGSTNIGDPSVRSFPETLSPFTLSANSALGSVVASYGFQDTVNATITAEGQYSIYNHGEPDRPFPLVTLRRATGFARLEFGDGTSSPDYGFRNHHSRLIQINAPFTPLTNGDYSLGNSSLRWSQVYAVNGEINTSDERAKQQISDIDEAVLRAWGKVNYQQYKLNNAVDAKGSGARWHIGLIAQRIQEAFESEGLDAFEYGLLCYDEWDEEPEIAEETPATEAVYDDSGNLISEAQPAKKEVSQEYRPAGNQYSIRYSEALALECAYLRSRLDA